MSAVQVKLSAVPPYSQRGSKISKSGERSFSDILVSKESPVNEAGKRRNEKSCSESESVSTGTEKPREMKRTKQSELRERSPSLSEQNDKGKAEEGREEKTGENNDVLAGFLNGMISDLALNIGTKEERIRNFLILRAENGEGLPDIDTWKEFVVAHNGLESTSEILTDEKSFKDFLLIEEMLNETADSVEMKQLTAGLTEGGLNLKELFHEKEQTGASESEIAEGFKEEGVPAGVNEAIMTGDEMRFGGENSKKESGKTEFQNEGAVHEGMFGKLMSEVKEMAGSERLPEGMSTQKILDQVTSEIRSLHAPDRMTLELMLQPATLGKVLIQVTSKNGMMQAEIKVENEATKTALENSLADLKLNFENNGFKVENVEITLADTGIGNKNGESGQEEQGKKNKGKGNRKMALAIGDDVGIESELKTESSISLKENGSGESVDYSA